MGWGRNREHLGHLMLPLAGPLLTTHGVFLSDPLLNLCEIGPNNISVFLTVNIYVYLLTPITLYLNILLLFLHIIAHADAPEAPIPVFLQQYLPQTAGTVSLANLLLGGPILVHVSVAEQSVGFAISAALVLLSLVFIVASVFKKILMSHCHAGKGFMTAFFALCIYTGTFLISFESIFKFDKKNSDSLVPFIPIELLFSLISFLVLMLTMALLHICIIEASAGGPCIPNHAQNLVISAVCVATATLLLKWYMNAYMTVTGMGSVPADAVELL